MRLNGQLKRLDAVLPKCDGRIARVVVAQEYTPTAADRCRLFGGCHVLVIKKKIVTCRDLVAREGKA